MRIRLPRAVQNFPFRFYARAVGIAVVFGLISAIATTPEDPLLVEVSRIEKAILDQGGIYAKQGLAQQILWGDPTSQSGGQFPNANAFGVMYLTQDPKSALPNPAYLEIIRRMKDLQKRIQDESYVRAPLARTDLKITNLMVAIDRYYVMMEFLFKNYYRVTHRKLSPHSLLSIEHLRELSLKVSPVIGFLYAQDSDQSQGQAFRVRGTWLDAGRTVLASEIRVHETDEQNWELLTLGDLGAPSSEDQEVAYKKYLKFMAIRQSSINRWAIRRTMPGGLYLRDEREMIRGCGQEFQSMGLGKVVISDAPFFQQLWARDFKSDVDARYDQILAAVKKQELFNLDDARKVVSELAKLFPNAKSVSAAPGESEEAYLKRTSEKALELFRADRVSKISFCSMAERSVTPAEFALVGAYQAGDLPNLGELARRITAMNFDQQKLSLICGAIEALGTMNLKSAEEIALEESVKLTADELNGLVEAKPIDKKKYEADLANIRAEVSQKITQAADQCFNPAVRVARINAQVGRLGGDLDLILRDPTFEKDRAEYRFDRFFEQNVTEAPAGIYATIVRDELKKWSDNVRIISLARPDHDGLTSKNQEDLKGYRAKEISADFAEIARSHKSRLRADRFLPDTTRFMVPQTADDLKRLYLGKMNRVFQGGYAISGGSKDDAEMRQLMAFQSDPLVGKYVEKFFSGLSRTFSETAQGLNPQNSPNGKGAEGVALGKVLLAVSRQNYSELRQELGMPLPSPHERVDMQDAMTQNRARLQQAVEESDAKAKQGQANAKAEKERKAAALKAEQADKTARAQRVVAIRLKKENLEKKQKIIDEKKKKGLKILPADQIRESEKVTKEEHEFYIREVLGQPSRLRMPESAIAKTDAHSHLKAEQHLKKQAMDAELGRTEKKDPTAKGMTSQQKQRVLRNYEEWLAFMGLYYVTVQPAKIALPKVDRFAGNPAKGEEPKVTVFLSSWREVEGMLLAQYVPPELPPKPHDSPLASDLPFRPRTHNKVLPLDRRSATEKALTMALRSPSDFSTNDWEDMLSFTSMSILDQEVLASMTIEDTRMMRPFLGLRMSVEANMNPILPKGKKIGIAADLETPTVLDHLKAAFDTIQGRVTNLPLAKRTFRAGIRIADESQKRMIEDFCLAKTDKLVEEENLFVEDHPADLRFKQVFVAMAPLRATLVPFAGIQKIDAKLENELKTNWELFVEAWDSVMSKVMVVFVTVLVIAVVGSVTGGAGFSLVGVWSTMVNGVGSIVGGGIQAKIITGFLMAMFAGLDPFSVADIALRTTIGIQMRTGLYENPEMNAYFLRLPFKPGAAVTTYTSKGVKMYLADNFNMARRAAFRMRFANSQMGGMEGMKISYQDLDSEFRAVDAKFKENVTAGLFNLIPLAFFKTSMGFKGRQAVMTMLEHLPESSPNRKALLAILSRSPKQIIQANGKNVAKTAYELLENAVEKWWTAMYRMDKVTVFRPGATIEEITRVYKAAYREALGNLLEKEPNTMGRIFRKEIDDLRSAQKALKDQLKLERATFNSELSGMPVSKRPKFIQSVAEFRNGLLDLAKKMSDPKYAKYRVLVPEDVLNQIPKVKGSSRLLAMRKRILILEGQLDDLEKTAKRLEWLESNYLGHVTPDASGAQLNQYYELLSEQDIQDTILVATKHLDEFKGAYANVDLVRKAILSFEYVKLERQSVYELLKEERKNDLKNHPAYIQIQSLGGPGIQVAPTSIPGFSRPGLGRSMIIHLN